MAAPGPWPDFPPKCFVMREAIERCAGLSGSSRSGAARKLLDAHAARRQRWGAQERSRCVIHAHTCIAYRFVNFICLTRGRGGGGPNQETSSSSPARTPQSTQGLHRALPRKMPAPPAPPQNHQSEPRRVAILER